MLVSPYSPLLTKLLNSVEGGLAVGFADYEGETIDLVGEIDDYRHRLHLAYQGILLQKLRCLLSQTQEFPNRVVFGCESTWIVIQPLKSSYFLVLTLQKNSCVSRASRILEEAAHELNLDL